MELRPGYKKSDIGVFPQDWDIIPVGDLFDFKNGLNKAKCFFGYGTPIVNYMDVFGHPSLRSHHVAGRVDVTKSERESYEIRKGDVFFTRTSETVEEIGIAAAMLDSIKDGVFSGFVLRARPKNESLDDLFKAYCFSPRYFRQQVIARATYTTRALTNGRSLSAALLARPPIREQKAIAEALSDVDASIAALSRLIGKKRDLRQGAMQRLLTGESRLPGFTAPWLEKRLGQCLLEAPSYGINAPAVPFSDRLPRYIRITDISEDGRFEPRPLVSVAAASPRYLLQQGDLVFARTGASVGKSYLYDPADGELIYAGFLIRIRPNSEILVPKFLAGLVATKPYWNWVKLTSMRSGQPGINGKEYAKFEFLCPEADEQIAIAEILTDMDAEIAALDARLVKARALKQSMMQALLTGRVRLPISREAAQQVKEAAYA